MMLPHAVRSGDLWSDDMRPGHMRLRPALILVLAAMVVGSGLAVLLINAQRTIREEAALEIARGYASGLRQLQQVYATNGQSRPEGGPLDAALSDAGPQARPQMEVQAIGPARHMPRDLPDLRATLRSDAPFVWRDKTPDPFDTRALAQLRATKDAEPIAFDTGADGQQRLRYATPITMSEACVECHNAHPASPRNDWRVGDIGGIHVIEIPVGVTGVQFPSRYELLLLGGVMAMALLAGVLIALSRSREIAARNDLAARQAEMERLNAARETASQTKNAFLANISHEVRTPLNGLLGLADLMAQDARTPGARDRAARMQTAGNSLLRVISDVLDFSQNDTHTARLTPAAFQPETLIAQVVGLFVPSPDAPPGPLPGGAPAPLQTEFVVTLDPDVPEWLLGDAYRIKQVLTRLLDNALKFTDAGHVELHVRRAHHDPMRLLFDIHDTGIGIPADQIDALFQPFAQADGSNTRRHGGTGLGLTLARSLAEQMGGTVRARSTAGIGSTFTLDLPLALVTTDTPAPAPNAPEGLRHVVVWAATPKVSTGLARVLERAGLSVTQAITPQDAHAQILSVSDAQSSLLIAAPYGAVPPALADLCGPAAPARALFLLPRGQAVDPLCPHVAHRPLMPGALMAHLSTVMHSTHLPPPAEPRAPSPAPQSAPKPDPAPDHGPLQGLRVLVVDDNELNRIVTKGFLERDAATVSLADSGAQALEIAARARFDVVLMDIQMPDMDGYETTRKLRTQGHHIPVLAVTANAMQHDIDRSASEGLQGHLAKPLSRRGLTEALKPYVSGGAPAPDVFFAPGRMSPPKPPLRQAKPPLPAAGAQMRQALRGLGVNVDRGLRLHGGTWSGYSTALAAFAHDTGHMPHDLRNALRQNDLETAAATCETMASHVFLIGAAPLARRARILARTLSCGRLPAQADVDHLCQSLDQITETIQPPRRAAAL